VAAGAEQVRCADAAREAARAAARGDPASAVASVAAQRAPRGAEVTVAASSQLVRVVVVARVAPLSHWLPSITVTGRAVAAAEPQPH